MDTKTANKLIYQQGSVLFYLGFQMSSLTRLSMFRIQTFVQGLQELSTIANRKQFYIGPWQ